VQHEDSTKKVELFVQTNLRSPTPQELAKDLEDSTYINHLGKTSFALF